MCAVRHVTYQTQTPIVATTLLCLSICEIQRVEELRIERFPNMSPNPPPFTKCVKWQAVQYKSKHFSQKQQIYLHPLSHTQNSKRLIKRKPVHYPLLLQLPHPESGVNRKEGSPREARAAVDSCPGSFLYGAVTYSPTFAVPSARRGLTSLFGMGRGGSHALSPP